MLALWFWYDYMFQILYLMATPMAWLSFFDENKEVRRRTVQEVRTRRYTVQGQRPNMWVTHSWGAYPSAHISRQLSAHTWGFSWYLANSIGLSWFWSVVLFILLFLLSPMILDLRKS